METRELGKSGLLVSALGLGCMGMSYTIPLLTIAFAYLGLRMLPNAPALASEQLPSSASARED